MISFLQEGGELAALQGQLGVADLASVRCYQRFCDEQLRGEASVQTLLEGQSTSPGPVKGSKGTRRKVRRGEDGGPCCFGISYSRMAEASTHSLVLKEKFADTLDRVITAEVPPPHAA